MSTETIGGYWQQRLVEMAKRDEKPVDTIDAELEQALASGLGYFFSKEELARNIVLLNGYESVQAAFDFKASMTKVQNLAGSSTEDIETISDGILKLAEPAQPEQPAKKTDKTPYYHRKKAQWWK